MIDLSYADKTKNSGTNTHSVLNTKKKSMEQAPKKSAKLNPLLSKKYFNNLWVLTRLFAFDKWKDISILLEESFQVKISINFISLSESNKGR